MEMLETIRNLPNVSVKDLKEGKLPKKYRNFENIVYGGLGASGISGDIIKDLFFDQMEIPLVITKGFSIPKFANEKTLFICVSYSGNTKEVISQLNDAIRSKCKIYIITSNGYLEEFAIKKKIPFTKVPRGFKPRMSVPYLFLAVTNLMWKVRIIKNQLSFENLKKYSMEAEKLASEIAKRIYNRHLVIYSEYYSVCHRFKSELNENAKMIARYDVLPELVHNEIESWKNLDGNHAVILFVDNQQSRQMEKVIQVLKEIFRNKTDLIEIRAKGESKLERIMYLIWVGDFISYFLSELRNEDHDNTPYIDLFKKKTA